MTDFGFEPAFSRAAATLCTGDSIIQEPSHKSKQQLSTEESAQHHRRLAEKWEHLVDRIRGIPGFETFLQPKGFMQLRIAAKAGPVAVVNVHETCCDAFILVDGLDEVVHIPLPAFSYTKAQELHLHLNQLFPSAGVHIRDPDV